METVDNITDSIWYARGNDYPWSSGFDFDEDLEEEEMENENSDENPIDFHEDMEIEENTNNPETIEDYPIADESPEGKTYYELRDSVEERLHASYLDKVLRELFVSGENLLGKSQKFSEQLAVNSEGTFYLDNSINMNRSSGLWAMRRLNQNLAEDIETLYEGNVVLGDLVVGEEAIDLKLHMHYGERLGSIYSEMTDTRFDRNVLRYIHRDNNAFFTYNINLRKAYEQTYDVLVSILSNAGDRVSSQLLVLEMLDEFINKDALFDLYQGSMFGTYDGIKKVKTKKIVFDYDEETFEYSERETEAEEDMPIFTMGFTTRRNDIPERILRRLSRTNENISNHGDYWEISNVVLKTAPLFCILKNDLFIVTNDDNLAKNYSNGYGKLALGRKDGKRARKSGVMYAHADMGKAIENIPRGIFNDQENELIDVIRGKSGTMEMTSISESRERTDMTLSYSFAGQSESLSDYILDLINSLYVISR